MEFANLRAFVEVTRSGSFSQATGILFITQPAVSKRVAGLETELNCRLFDRIGRQIVLTEAGRQLLPRAEQIVEEITDIRRELSNLSGEVGGTLAMGTSHHIGLHRLPPFLRSYADSYPAVTLDIRFMGSEKACLAVESGELELGVVTLPLQPSRNLLTQQVWHDPLCFIVGEEHPLAGRANIGIEELIQHPAVLPTLGTYTRTLPEDRLEAEGYKINCSLSTDYLETLKMLASIGLGWALLPETLLTPGLIRLNVEEIRLERALGLVTHRQRTLSNAAQAMQGLILPPRSLGSE
ncbi:LysR family transcriptional regulator [endosymbiont of Lamellibrachia barhami]|uniref:LysR family transcriptional regulator n=1 Tax=endosymbiont of Lamellibrachia barhami TaxID=205975 RepID=UPI0015AFE978